MRVAHTNVDQNVNGAKQLHSLGNYPLTHFFVSNVGLLFTLEIRRAATHRNKIRRLYTVSDQSRTASWMKGVESSSEFYA